MVVCKKCSKEYIVSLTNPYHFVNIDIKQQLMTILRDSTGLNNILENFSNAQKKDANKNKNISDIFDGELYQNLEVSNSEKDKIVLTLNINSNGAAIFKNSKYSLWSILFSINELPLESRFQNIFVAGALYTNYEPNFALMNLFLTQFFIQNKAYIESGIEIGNSNGKIIKVIVLPFTSVVQTESLIN